LPVSWLKLVPGWAWGVLVAMALTFAAGWWVNGARWEAKLADAQRGHADDRQQWADQALASQAEQRRIERERQSAINGVQRDAEQQIETARADADRAGDALDRLQQRFENAARNSRACGNSITAQLSQTADTAARMQADVFRRTGAAAQLYAGVADERGVAGTACEAAYGVLR
jgi:hypothetical protein